VSTPRAPNAATRLSDVRTRESALPSALLKSTAFHHSELHREHFEEVMRGGVIMSPQDKCRVLMSFLIVIVKDIIQSFSYDDFEW